MEGGVELIFTKESLGKFVIKRDFSSELPGYITLPFKVCLISLTHILII